MVRCWKGRAQVSAAAAAALLCQRALQLLYLVPGDDLVGGGDEVGEGHNLSSLFFF